jgi:hypothetical protein
MLIVSIYFERLLEYILKIRGVRAPEKVENHSVKMLIMPAFLGRLA